MKTIVPITPFIILFAFIWLIITFFNCDEICKNKRQILIKIDNIKIKNYCNEIGGNIYTQKTNFIFMLNGVYIATFSDEKLFNYDSCFYKGKYIRNEDTLKKLIFEKKLVK